MNEKIINTVTDFLAVKSKRGIVKGSDDYQILKYGIEVFYYEATKTVLLLILSVVLGITVYVFVFMAVFGGLRVFARGIHFKSPSLCFVMGFLNYLAGIYLALNLIISLPVTIAGYVACFILNFIYAPSPTENTPVDEKERGPLRIYLFVLMIGFFILMLIIGENAWRNIVLIATASETLHILPCTYKLFKEKRG